jgi:ubiquinone biosynthesis protein
MLDELGPTFVKFGQLLSTRPDVVPPDIVIELRGLQDDVKPFPFAQVRDVVEAELGLTMEQAFVEFDELPIASASIGQVHRALLPDGQEVAVKVQRPAAAGQIEADLGLLYQAVKLLKERVRALEFIDPQELVDEFARSIRLELDYGHEARNAEAFHRNFADDEAVVVPRVVKSYSTGRILTLEYLHGTKVSELDLDAMEPSRRRDVAYRMADTWMTMVFRHGFFHSDPHPANIFVLDTGEIGLVDFGQAGKLTDEDMTKLTRLFVDAATENVDAIPRRLRELGVRYAPERENEFRAELRILFDRYYGTRLSDIDPLQVIREAFGLIYSLNLRLPSRFVMLDKAIATLASVGAEVYPDFNVFEVAKPYARGLLADRYQPRVVLQRARTEAMALGSVARELPYQAHDVLERMRDGSFQVRFDNPGLDKLDEHIDQASNRLSVALVVLGGLVGSSIVGVFAEEGPQVMGLHVLSFFGFVLSAVFGLWLMWGVIRHGRL